MEGEAVDEAGGEAFITQDAHLFAEGEIGGDDHGDMLSQGGASLEQKLGASRGEGDIAELIQDDEVKVK